MLASVNLNYKLSFQTHEIYDVRAYELLPSELHTIYLLVPQSCPEIPFSDGLLSTKPTGKSSQFPLFTHVQ